MNDELHTLRRNCFYVGCHNYEESEVNAQEWKRIMDSPNNYACDQHRKQQQERRRSREVAEHLDSLAEQGCY